MIDRAIEDLVEIKRFRKRMMDESLPWLRLQEMEDVGAFILDASQKKKRYYNHEGHLLRFCGPIFPPVGGEPLVQFSLGTGGYMSTEPIAAFGKFLIEE